MEPDSKLNLDILPPEVVTQFLLRLSLKDLANYCQTSKAANAYCESDAFWKDKYRYDFGLSLPKNPTKKWINLYKERIGRNSPISAGGYHYAVIDNKGILYMAGNNSEYQLGDGTNNSSRIPIRLTSFTEKIISVSCGNHFTIAITEDGKAYKWGTFYTPTREIKVPTLIADLENYKTIKVSCGGMGWAVILDNGSAYYSISIKFGEKQMVRIAPLKEKVIDISVTSCRVGMVTSSGNLYLFGLGFGGFLSGKLEGFLISPTGELVSETDNSAIDPIHFPPEHVKPGEISKHVMIKNVSLARYHIMALSVNGDIFSWGINERGRLGLGWKQSLMVYTAPQKITMKSKISYIGTYDNTSYAITIHGKLYVWGSDHYMINRELGLKSSISGQIIGTLGDFIIKSPLEINIGHRVNYVSFGVYFAIATTGDGMVNYMGDPLLRPPN